MLSAPEYLALATPPSGIFGLICDRDRLHDDYVELKLVQLDAIAKSVWGTGACTTPGTPAFEHDTGTITRCGEYVRETDGTYAYVGLKFVMQTTLAWPQTITMQCITPGVNFGRVSTFQFGTAYSQYNLLMYTDTFYDRVSTWHTYKYISGLSSVSTSRNAGTIYTNAGKTIGVERNGRTILYMTGATIVADTKAPGVAKCGDTTYEFIDGEWRVTKIKMSAK